MPQKKPAAFKDALRHGAHNTVKDKTERSERNDKRYEKEYLGDLLFCGADTVFGLHSFRYLRAERELQLERRRDEYLDVLR